MSGRKILRCACYTRKSSDEGLDQEFNSLDAQREACEAYVKSHAPEGWKLLSTRYDDGGYSGGTMERPALKRLMEDIAAGKIDMIVVYKIDRLSRSLSDFARMVELFDKYVVSFDAVTQPINSATSMGRLMLNVLLSFAQFEREVTGERIRDKIAASKAKGMWMGGCVPMGYDKPRDTSRILIVNDEEAQIVRTIFTRYLELRSVHALERWLKDNNIRTKSWVASSGRIMGGVPFQRGGLFHMLRNPLYRGFIPHKGKLYPGGHDPIVSEDLFEKAGQHLAAAARRRSEKRTRIRSSTLAGRIFDAAGEPMSPTRATGKSGKSWRYYVSASLQQGSSSSGTLKQTNAANPDLIQRVPAPIIEQQIVSLINRLIPNYADDPLTLPRRVAIHRNAVHLILPREVCQGIEPRLSGGEAIGEDVSDSECLRLIVPMRFRNRRGKTEIASPNLPTPKRDPFLVNALRRAHAMVALDTRRMPLVTTSPTTQYGRRLIRLAFLAPDLQQAILAGTQPADLTLDKLLASPIPADWNEQRALFA